MKSLLAAILLIGAVVAVLTKQVALAFILAPLAWFAAKWAAADSDDLYALMGACFAIAVVSSVIDLGRAAFS